MPKLKKSAPKKAKQSRMADEMRKFSKGAMHSGSKTGPVVTNPAQAKAIGMSESGQASKKPPTAKQMPDLQHRSSVAKNRKSRNKGRN